MPDEDVAEFGDRINELRSHQERSLEDVAEEAGIHRTTLGKIERGDREPSISNTLAIADALNVSILELVSPREFRTGTSQFLIDDAPVYDKIPIEAPAVLSAVDQVYENMDVIDFAFRRRGTPALAELFDEYSALSTAIGEFFASGFAAASGGTYRVNPGNFPDLVDDDGNVSGIEIKVAMEKNMPKGHLPKEGMYITVRYVLGDRERNYNKNKRGDTAWIWEIRMGRIEEDQFNFSNTAGDSGKTATFSSDALWGLDCLYLDPEMMPYTRYPDKESLSSVQNSTF